MAYIKNEVDYKRMKKDIDKLIKEAKTKVVKEGDNYSAIHSWLRRTYGKANHCESSSCNGKSKTFNNALLKGKIYERNRDNFVQLCASCHSKYDETEEGRKRKSEWRTGLPRPYLWRKVYKIDNSGKIVEEYESVTACAKSLGKKAGSFYSNYIAEENRFRRKYRFVLEDLHAYSKKNKPLEPVISYSLNNKQK